MTYVKVNEQLYPTVSIMGRIHDFDWDNRDSKYITLNMDYNQAAALFVDDVQWSIVEEEEDQRGRIDGDGNPIIHIYEFDNSEYSVAGNIVGHRDGTVTIAMGKPTVEELLALIEEAL